MNIYVTLILLLILVHYAISEHEFERREVEYGVEYWCKIADRDNKDSHYDSSKEDVKGAIHIVACDGEYLILDCGLYKIIKIIKANYGRKDINTCSKSEKLSFTSCYSKDTINVVQRRCEKRSTCKLKADISVFGEPCRFVEKYLEVEYTCESAQTAVACEGNEITLTCEGEKYLKIANAIYEKSAKCTGLFSLLEHQCTSTDSLEKVQDSCQHRNRCKIYADGNDLGVPCPLVTRQLKIKYSCQDSNENNEDDDDKPITLAPKIMAIWSRSVSMKIDRNKMISGEEYQLQYKLSNKTFWSSLTIDPRLDLSNSVTLVGLSPGFEYDIRIVLKRMSPKKCVPFVRFTSLYWSV